MKNGEDTIIHGEVLEVPQSGAKAAVQTEAIQMDAIMMENLIQILMEHAALDMKMRTQRTQGSVVAIMEDVQLWNMLLKDFLIMLLKPLGPAVKILKSFGHQEEDTVEDTPTDCAKFPQEVFPRSLNNASKMVTLTLLELPHGSTNTLNLQKL